MFVNLREIYNSIFFSFKCPNGLFHLGAIGGLGDLAPRLVTKMELSLESGFARPKREMA